ncbi:hypothetical protein K3X13_01210 [Aliiroseovarius crassostreae]|uniref:hypothetical protein n=1 Tax=Aliiroseovarius crassostreae TaxID=154981 RepID=UPI00220F5116|nr:hypothetical protein [Aliiroseovarius crassostreae]UWP92515.1 hypothetical protein K3X13_01210 [Aliiroseovarius crassostreae]
MPTMLTPEQIERFRSGKGSPYLAPNEVLPLLPWLNQNGLFVQSMEAVEIDVDSDSKPGRLDLSILGLDEEENWEAHRCVERANRLAEVKLKLAVECENPIEVQIWIDYGMCA